jgi:hypothetical protein
VWSPPAAIALTPLLRPVTWTGTLLPVNVPLPSFPDSLEPQHMAAPSSITAQVCRDPAAIPIAAKDAGSGVPFGRGVVPCVGDWVSDGDVWPGVGLVADEQAVIRMPITRAFPDDDRDAGISTTSSNCP